MFRASEKGINCGFFNQDSTRLSLGTHEGYKIIKCSPDLKSITSCEDESTSIIQLYYNTGLIAHVGGGDDASSSQRCMKITNVRTQKEIIRMSYTKKIVAIRINRKFLVLATDDNIRIYDMASMKLQHTISSPPSNPNGVLALATCHIVSEGDQACRHLLCYPKSNEKGDLFVYDVENQRLLYNLEAHTSPVACATFNNTGSLLATASDKGTVIKVFSTSDRTKLFELRRGVATRAHIISMNFCAKSEFLAVSSDKASVHVFKLDDIGAAQQAAVALRSAAPAQPSSSSSSSQHQQEDTQRGDAHTPPPTTTAGTATTTTAAPASATTTSAAVAQEQASAQTWTGYFTAGLSAAVGYVAPTLTKMWEERRSFAIASLEEAVENTSALTYEDGQLVVMVFTAKGDLYKFAVHDDGQCEQLTRTSVLDMPTRAPQQSQS